MHNLWEEMLPMKIEGLTLSRKSRYNLARKKYADWANARVESKIYKATLFALCGGECPSCGVDMVLSYNKEINEQPNSATLDHVVPLSKVLEHQKYGLQILCFKCNVDKGHKFNDLKLTELKEVGKEDEN